MFFVYVLKSKKDGKLYIGQTNDVNKRLLEHNSGKSLSTKHRIPFELVGFEEFKTRNEARWFEYNLKHHSDKKKKFINKLTKNESHRPGRASGPEGR